MVKITLFDPILRKFFVTLFGVTTVPDFLRINFFSQNTQIENHARPTYDLSVQTRLAASLARVKQDILVAVLHVQIERSVQWGLQIRLQKIFGESGQIRLF